MGLFFFLLLKLEEGGNVVCLFWVFGSLVFDCCVDVMMFIFLYWDVRVCGNKNRKLRVGWGKGG